MAAQVFAVGATATANSDEIVLPLPAGLVGGEALVAVLHGQSSAQATGVSSPGWTRVSPPFVPNSLALRETAALWRTHVAGTAAPRFVFSGGGRLIGFIVAITGASSAAPTVSIPHQLRDTLGNTLAVPAPSQSGLTLEVWAASFGSPNSSTFTAQPAISSLRVSRNPTTDPESTAVSRSALACWGGVAPYAAHSITTAGNSTHAAAFAIRFADLPPAAMRVLVNRSGVAAVGRFHVSDGAAIKAVRTVARFDRGFPSVTAMLASTRPKIAHRGGSRAFPEMTRYAYVQANLRQYAALELSLARTSDGVWFGLHDETLQRTSPAAPATPASGLTWAQVQGYQVAGSTAEDRPDQSARPYATLSQILGDFGGSHVIFIDPKHAMVYADELLTILDGYPGATDRFVAKFFGEQGGLPENSTSWAGKARARGYRSWGYFYAGGNFAYAPRWDILGMDVDAPQSAWDQLRAAAPGKPVLGHIVATRAQYTAGLARGADGFMVSGVTKINALE